MPEPDLADGEKSFDDGRVRRPRLAAGALRAGAHPSRRSTAVDGWGGDSYAAYERDGASCVTVNYRGDTPEDLAQMQTALQAWADKGPKGPAQRHQGRRDPGLHSCDPGKKAAKVADGKSMDALTLALTRTYLSIDAGQGRHGARPGRPLRR